VPTPVEPPPTPWALPAPGEFRRGDLVAVGADLAPGTLLAAYRSGLFPMRVGRQREIGWWSPDPRGVIPLDGLRVSRSLRRSCAKFEIRFDTSFTDVMRACGDPGRDGGWIDEDFVVAYSALHRSGWAHSVECWQGDVLVGGLYGVAIGGLFAGESMFHRVTDASKVALVALVERLGTVPGGLLDVQWVTPHLATLGAVEIPRTDYLARLPRALTARSPWAVVPPRAEPPGA
jgi:leucyl/phenylalanyl-tRNA--protein transferase